MSEINKKELTELPLISVVIPVYNTEKYLITCIDSILGNSYKKLEVICVDDGSTDNSLEILEYYAKKDKRVKVIKQKQKGPSAARNAALDAATGEYISFVDSDDFVQWNMYEILSEVVSKHKLDIVMFGANTFGSNHTPEWIWPIINTNYHYYQDCDGCRVAFEEKTCRPFLWLHLVRRELFEKNSKIRFDETMKLGEDQLVQLQYIPRAKNVMVIDDKLYNYRISRSGSLMQMYSDRVITKVKTHMILVQKVIDKWKEQGIYENNEDLLLTWIVNFLYYSIVGLPQFYKIKYAQKIIELVTKNKFRIFLLAEWEMPRYNEMKMWSEESVDVMDDITDYQKKIEQEKYEISEILKSKAFKLGRKLTKKADLLDYEKYKEFMQ